MINLMQDFYFWIGLFLFVISVYGMIWILKTLEKLPSKTVIPPQKTVSEPLPAIQPKIKTVTPGADTQTLSVPKNESAAVPRKELSLEQLSKQVEKIEETFQAAWVKSDQSHQSQNEKISEDVKAILQILRSKTFDESIKKEKEQLIQVVSKMDQIYQVLSSLSKPEGGGG